MKLSRWLLAIGAAVFFSGCAHPISVSPDVAKMPLLKMQEALLTSPELRN